MLGDVRAVELVHQLPVHRSGGVEVLGELSDFGFELGDALALTVVVALELGGALLEPFEERLVGFSASDIGSGTKLAAEALTEQCDLFGKTTGALLRVRELDSQALLGDKRTRRQVPRAVAAGLALAITNGCDAAGELGVGVEQ